MTNQQLELYIHIPFCVRKCNYCDFASISADNSIQEMYCQALLKEIEYKSIQIGKIRQITSIYIGGGTPTIFNFDTIRKICSKIYDSFNVSDDAEFSIEANPGTINSELSTMLPATAINRVSIGVQSFNDNELKLLGRIHDKNIAIDTIKTLGDYNLNIDLIFGFPTQTLDSWLSSLQTAISLKPEHISTYSLIVESGTKMGEWIESGKYYLPDEEIEDSMYLNAVDILKNAGYLQYEVSNFALPNKECKHNIGYWKSYDYIGIGSSAASYINKIRFKNCDDVNTYISNINADVSPVVYAERNSNKVGLIEEVMLGLRMRDGINLDYLETKWRCELKSVSRNYMQLLNEGVLEYENSNLKLSDENFRFANSVIVSLMNDL